MEMLRSQGVVISPDNLMISLSAPIILPVHQRIDQAREVQRGEGKIGTTGRGIGPAYEDKVARRGLRMGDLLDMEVLAEKIEALLAHHNIWLNAVGEEMILPAEIINPLAEMRDVLDPYLGEVWALLDYYRKKGKRILFEGAQGVMLDIDHGTYPFVTSSNTVPGQVAAGAGIGSGSIGYVLGITKAYTTRVGSGPFPTEDFGDDGESMGVRGREFGTVTGRKRRCGWFDAVMVRQAGVIAGIDGMALTKLDVLDGFKTLKICVGYKLDDKEIDRFPASAAEQARVQPIYEVIEGWSESTMGARSWAELPPQAVKYIKRLEELTGIPVASVSTSPERDDTILVKDPFEG
jgi:adenylosuccinate synthase